MKLNRRHSLKLTAFLVSFLFFTGGLFAQDWDDDFESDGDANAKPKGTPLTKDQILKKKDVDDESEDEFEKEDAEKEKKAAAAEEKARQAELEKLKAEERAKAQALHAAELERQAKEAERLRKQEELRKMSAEARRKERAERKAYRDTFYGVMSQNEVELRLPAKRGLLVGAHFGFWPNIGNSSSEGYVQTSALPAVPGIDGRVSNQYKNSNPVLGLSQIANLYRVSAQQVETSKSDSSPNTTGKTMDSSAGIDSLPIGVSAQYRWDLFLVRMGVNLHTSLNTLGGSNSYQIRFTNANSELETVTVTYEASIFRMEIPFTAAIRFLSNSRFGGYIGGGLTYFIGENSSTFELKSDKTDNVTETNSFSASAIGFHFILGIEGRISDRVYLTTELFQNFGRSELVFDSNVDDNEKGPAQPGINLNFDGTEILFGINYLVDL